MPNDPTGLTPLADSMAKIVNSEVVNRAYEDALSKPLAETSDLAHDIIKGLRLFTTPFVLMADYRERLLAWCAVARSKVPEDRQVEAPSNVVGPIFERLKYERPDSKLVDLYLQLLISSIDSDRVGNTHPAFPGVISQLSPDQAFMLLHLKRHGNIETEDTCEFEYRSNECTRTRTLSSTLPGDRIQSPTSHIHTLLWHMLGLNLVDRPSLCAEIRSFESSQRASVLWVLSDFGELFAEACVPDEPIVGFDI
jgi:hypothetical protein